MVWKKYPKTRKLIQYKLDKLDSKSLRVNFAFYVPLELIDFDHMIEILRSQFFNLW